MKNIKIDLSENLTNLEVHTFADLHIGDPGCNINSVIQRIKAVRDNPNAVAILNGDLMNNAIKTSVSDIYSEQLSPMKQLEACVELFEPIKDKIICITTGNHERRTYNGAGISMMEIFAKELGLEDVFTNESAVVFLRFGWNNARKRKQWYSINVTHGSGGGRKEGAKATRLAEMASIVDCDIYVHSHTHLPMIMKQGFYRTDFINSDVKFVEKMFVNTSAELDYGGYGEIYEFKPSSRTCPVIHLNGLKKEFTAVL